MESDVNDLKKKKKVKIHNCKLYSKIKWYDMKNEADSIAIDMN